MKTSRRFNRRSFFATVTGAGTLVLFPRQAAALQDCSDTDSGAGADPGGHGRTCAGRPQTGVTDRDPSDPAGRGRGTLPEMHGGPRPTNTTDSDSGPNADPAGRGRGRYGEVRSGVTDSDRPPNADPAGNGRGQRPGEQREQERWQDCSRLSGRRDELRGELLDPQYWSTDQIYQAQGDAGRINSLFETDEDGYIHGRYENLMRSAEDIARRYGLDCTTQRCTNVAYELQERAARAGGSYNSGQHIAIRDELARIEGALGRNCPGIR